MRQLQKIISAGTEGSEPEKDEKEEDSDAESWADTRVKGWLRPRVKTRRMNESAPESFWRQETGGPWAVFLPKTAVSDPSPHSKFTCRSCRFDAKMSNTARADAFKSPGPPSARNSPSTSSPPAEDSSFLCLLKFHTARRNVELPSSMMILIINVTGMAISP
jgi:hypothetical protein